MLTELTATELSAKLKNREVSAPELAQAYLDRIDAIDDKVGAYLAVDPEFTLSQAADAQALLDAGKGGALTGVPIALKDNMSTIGLETTCASKILKGYMPQFDATVVEKLKAEGTVVLGKLNLDEFAMGSSTENSAFKKTHNPWDLARTPGGSSGGSAAAVAADLAPITLGSDTGGSIRLPASFSGIVGFKPTYGRCSRYGLIAFGSSLDQIGPLAKTVEDIAVLSNAITGHCDRDSTSLPNSQIQLEGLKSGSLKGMRLAFPKEMLGEDTDDGVKNSILASLDALRAEGVVIDEVSIPTIPLGVTTYYIIAPAEASSNLARFDGVRYGVRVQGQGHIDVVAKTRAEGFGHEVKSRIMIGTYALSAGYYDAFYIRAQQVRALMTAQFNEVYSNYDFVVSPTAPVTAFPLGALDQDPMQMKLLDYCTIPANMGGFPAISLPVGLVNGLPVGLQLMGPNMSDERLLAASYCVESLFDFNRNKPPSIG
ncbi:MAG TPA: Asp-tRNA(Asn)/Glu-tRNA(Gln) amidotransferase subunit GatA [Fimbriimonas sp.]|nr:Asp-tRNA(Asn)/Glu-tRNA(Gln) amidotransferase subunit GatA [Fimbriimonas sp.]